jgi:hypothetical protein
VGVLEVSGVDEGLWVHDGDVRVAPHPEEAAAL